MDKDFETMEVEIQLCNVISNLYKENKDLKKELEKIKALKDYWILKCSELTEKLKKVGDEQDGK